jgi:GMP synthase (glutamine-hydrolysing)
MTDLLHEQKILILDFGSQYTQNIARKIRECEVYCEIHPCTMTLDKVSEFNPKGIILSGGPASVLDADSPLCDP